jgi:DNA polymerase-3 subunit delta
VAAKKQQSPASRIHVIVGTDEGQVREAALMVWKDLTGGVDDGFTHETIEGNAGNVDEALTILGKTEQALLTYSMFGGDKVVWLRNATFMGNDRTAESESTIQGIDGLLQLLNKGLPDGVSFLLSASKIDKRRGFWKFLEKNDAVQVYDKIYI